MRDLWFDVVRDVQCGVKAMLASKSFTATAVLTLVLGIGATTAIFSFVDGVLLRPLPYDDPDRIVFLWQRPPDGTRNSTSALNFRDWQTGSTVFEHLAAITRAPVSISGMDEPIMVRGARVSASYFSVFQITTALGRTFARGEDLPGKDQIVVISHQLWRARFGGDAGIVGRTLIIDGAPHVVIGVLPSGSAFDREATQIWRPLAFSPAEETRDFNWLHVIGRLKPNVSIQRATGEMDAIAARIAQDHPESNKGWGITIERYTDAVVAAPLRRSLHVMLGGACVLLLLSCANLANLMLIRGIGRRGEIALRTTLGATRSRLIRQFVVESLLLSLLGAAGGFALANGLVWMVQQLLPPFSLPADAVVAIDRRVLAFVALVAIGTSALCSLAPTVHVTKPDLAQMLKGSGRTMAGDSSGRARDLLVTAQIALAFILLVWVGVLGKSFLALMQVDTGFDDTNVITMGLPIPESRFENGTQLSAYLRRVVDSIESVPGVQHAAATSALPMRGWGFGLPFQIVGAPAVDRTLRRVGFFKMITPSYFDALGMRQVRGRRLLQSDVKGTPPVVVINETMAARHFGGEDPIGKRIAMNEILPIGAALGPEIEWLVVGIVVDEKVRALDDISPGVYVSVEQSPTTFMNLVVRGHFDTATLERPIQTAVRGVDKDQPLPEMRTLAGIKSQVAGADRLRTIVLLAFATLAVLLAAIGIYGVVAYSVAQRGREIGIRAALGAGSQLILARVVRQGMILAGSGILLGGAAAFASTRLLSSVLFGVTANDPMAFGAATLLLGVVAGVASLAPALQAARLDPSAVLRRE